MSPAASIHSGAPAGARIEGSRLVSVPAAAMPERSLGLGPFAVEPAASGLPQLVDATGTRWGVFANPALAAATAARLSS